MADKQVRIVISAQDNFSQVMAKYQQAMGQATRDTQQFNNAAGNSTSGVDSLTSAVGNAVKGFIAFQAVGMVSELVQLGGAANATQATFTALSGGVAEATNTLNTMRAATGGIVADVDLMAGANRLLAMRIAESGQQAADLAAVAVNLGRAFGQDAASAIENFSLMIANQSLLRLDSLGISAAAVRARMAELKDEFPEMDKQARFTQATLEQATKTVDRLGTSITAAQTPVAQLETRFENFKTSIGQSLATTINSAITSIEQLGTVIEHQLGTTSAMSVDQEQAVVDNAKVFAEKWGESFAEYIGTAGMPADFNPVDMLRRIEGTRMTLGMNADPGAMVQMAGEDMWYSQNNIERMKIAYAMITQDGLRAEQHQARMAQYGALMNAFRAAEAGGGSIAGAGGGVSNATMRQYYGGGGTISPYQPLLDAFGGTTGANEIAAMQGRYQYADDKMFQFEHNTAGIGGMRFLDPAAYEDIKKRFEELQQLNEEGLITDESLEKAKVFREQAEGAYKAFMDMSLTDIFGQSGGGMQGEIGDMVIDQMKKNGASDEEIAAAQRTFNLGSGRETAASVAMSDKVAPMLASLPPEQAQKAMENIEAFLQAAAKMNMTPDQIANLLPGATGFTAGGGAGSFSVKPGDTLSALAAQLGIPVETLLAATGASSARTVQPGSYSFGTGYAPIAGFNPAAYAQGYGPQMGTGGAVNPFVAGGFMTQGGFDASVAAHGENAGAANPADSMKEAEEASSGIFSNMQQIAGQLDEVNTKADAFNGTLDLAAASREMTITVNVKDNTKGLLELMIGANKLGTLSFAQGAGGSVRDNGGRVPGVDPRVNQRPGVAS